MARPRQKYEGDEWFRDLYIRFGGNTKEIAKHVGMSLASIYYWKKKYEEATGESLDALLDEVFGAEEEEEEPPVVSPSKQTLQSLVERLEKMGYIVELHDRRDFENAPATKLPVKNKYAVAIEDCDISQYVEAEEHPVVELEVDAYDNEVVFAVVSDTHIGNKYSQLTHLRSFYDAAKKAGAQVVLHCGDMLDGYMVYGSAHVQELYAHGATAQINIAKKYWPDTLPTYVIRGNHEYVFCKNAGMDILAHLDHEREDIYYINNIPGAKSDIRGAATVVINGVRVYIVHPKGGPSYAKSYKWQKYAEHAAINHYKRPHAVFLGHFHFYSNSPARMINGAMVPCFQATNSYIAGAGYSATIGGLIIRAKYINTHHVDMTIQSVIYTPIKDDYKNYLP